MANQTDQEPPISIEHWYALERRRLDEFVAFWRNGAAGHDVNDAPADAFPLNMEVGEWDEQYRSWGGA